MELFSIRIQRTFQLVSTVSTLMKKLKSNKDKAEFALQLCDRLETEVAFDVPDYIKDAILFIAPSE